VRIIVQRSSNRLYTQRELDAAIDAALKNQAKRLGSHNERITGAELSVAWAKYKNLFQNTPRGTVKQLSALLELVPARVRKAA
jgi:hypothetical protein